VDAIWAAPIAAGSGTRESNPRMQIGKLPFYHGNTPAAGQGGVERRASGNFYRFGYEGEEDDGKIMDGKIISGNRDPHFLSIPLAGGHDRAPLGIGA
jgi:hypothetical protein